MADADESRAPPDYEVSKIARAPSDKTNAHWLINVRNRSRGMGLRSKGKAGLNRRISNKELQNVEGQ